MIVVSTALDKHNEAAETDRLSDLLFDIFQIISIDVFLADFW